MAEVPDTSEDPKRASGDEDLLDPRVKEELEILNSTAEEINKLEIELDHARAKFRSLLNDATQRLNVLYKKLGRCVTKARSYYELLKESKKAQGEAQRAVVKFHRANGIYRAAKETVALAEERLMSMGDDGEKREFDAAWQEMLNHATMKFMDSEKEKTLSEQEHYRRAAELAEIQKKMKAMEKSMPRTIPRSRPYFELKEKLEFQLQQEKLNWEDLVRALQLAKARYRAALGALEAISEEVHMKRRMASVLPPRTPGVGAENLTDLQADLPSINLDLSSESAGDVISINSDDFDAISTDGSEVGDDSPRLEPRSISLPVSPLARDISSPSFTRARSASGAAAQGSDQSKNGEDDERYDWRRKALERPKKEVSEMSRSSSEVAETPRSLSEVTETPRSSSEVTETPRSFSEVMETPRSSSEVAETPRSSSEIAETPTSSSEVTGTPKSLSEVTEIPKSSSEVTEMPKSSSEVPETSRSLSEVNKMLTEVTVPQPKAEILHIANSNMETSGHPLKQSQGEGISEQQRAAPSVRLEPDTHKMSESLSPEECGISDSSNEQITKNVEQNGSVAIESSPVDQTIETTTPPDQKIMGAVSAVQNGIESCVVEESPSSQKLLSESPQPCGTDNEGTQQVGTTDSC